MGRKAFQTAMCRLQFQWWEVEGVDCQRFVDGRCMAQRARGDLQGGGAIVPPRPRGFVQGIRSYVKQH